MDEKLPVSLTPVHILSRILTLDNSDLGMVEEGAWSGLSNVTQETLLFHLETKSFIKKLHAYVVSLYELSVCVVQSLTKPLKLRFFIFYLRAQLKVNDNGSL